MSPRAPDFDALLRQGAQGLAVLRKLFTLVPSQLINTNGPTQTVDPEQAFNYLLPIAMLLKPSGIAGAEVLTISVDTAYLLGSNSFVGLNDPNMGPTVNQPYLRGVPQPSLSPNNQWEEFDTSWSADHEPVTSLGYKIKSSIGLSVAQVQVVFYLYEVTA